MTAEVTAPFALGEELGLTVLEGVARGGGAVALPASTRARLERNRAYVDELLAAGETVYGVTTGFGRFASTRIEAADVAALQRNLLLSHAVGVGEPLAQELVRAMLLLRAQSLALGASGVRPVVVELLVALLNERVHPVIPAKGSVGASGDLAPLAHMALVLIGEGEAEHAGERLPAREALHRAGLEPVELAAKEGLALINGTQLMAAHVALAMCDARRLTILADIAAAMTVEALLGSHAPFQPAVTRLRPHPGAVAVAHNMRNLLVDSEIVLSHADCGKVQDPYSLRAVPQVHGASRDALAHVTAVVETELRSVTDNPLVVTDEGDDPQVISAGNFHGQPLALVADYGAIALAELANISERRTEQLVNPALSGLPAFLTEHGGLSSGLMVAQYTAAALVSENKVLAHPASVDSIPTSANQEDHVSMGAHAARKLRDVLDNTAYVIAVELLAAAQALDFRAPLKPGKGVAAAHAAVRAVVPHLATDRYLKPDLEAAHGLLRGGALESAVAAAGVELT